MATKTTTTTTPKMSLDTEETLDFPDLPPFPTNIPTAPLHRLSLKALREERPESGRFFDASKELGFFYLDLRGDREGEELLQLSNELFSLAPQLYDLGRDELSKYDYKNQGSYMGYKGFGSAVVDEEGNLDRNEFYNIPKDDFLDISPKPFAHPAVLNEKKELIGTYTHTSHSLISFLLQHLNSHLNLCPGTLPNIHQLCVPSGDQIRLIKSPPQPESDSRTALGKHTDFGSLTLLFNRLGGLQILPPPSPCNGKEPEWTYVRPLAGHCIVNLGDAMTRFSGGLLRSNIHRVVAPPGEQAKETRWSVVYFARPNDDVILKRLKDMDGMMLGEKIEGEGEEMNSKQWIELQAMRLRSVRPDMGDEERKKLWEESGRGK